MTTLRRKPPNAGKGRPKGSQNKSTGEIRDFARLLITDPMYVASLQLRLSEGKAPHMETLLYHYAYGKPKEQVEVSSAPEGITIKHVFAVAAKEPV